MPSIWMWLQSWCECCITPPCTVCARTEDGDPSQITVRLSGITPFAQRVCNLVDRDPEGRLCKQYWCSMCGSFYPPSSVTIRLAGITSRSGWKCYEGFQCLETGSGGPPNCDRINGDYVLDLEGVWEFPDGYCEASWATKVPVAPCPGNRFAGFDLYLVMRRYIGTGLASFFVALWPWGCDGLAALWRIGAQPFNCKTDLPVQLPLTQGDFESCDATWLMCCTGPYSTATIVSMTIPPDPPAPDCASLNAEFVLDWVRCDPPSIAIFGTKSTWEYHSTNPRVLCSDVWELKLTLKIIRHLDKRVSMYLELWLRDNAMPPSEATVEWQVEYLPAATSCRALMEWDLNCVSTTLEDCCSVAQSVARITNMKWQ